MLVFSETLNDEEEKDGIINNKQSIKRLLNIKNSCTHVHSPSMANFTHHPPPQKSNV